MQPGTLFFQCNICGTLCTVELASLARRAKSCPTCDSSPRTRALIRTLSNCLFQENLILSEFPIRKDIKGLGLTDPEGYASQLKQKFDYVNTYFHQEPRLDIASDSIAPEQRQVYDFIISSEVFEHRHQHTMTWLSVRLEDRPKPASSRSQATQGASLRKKPHVIFYA